MPRYEDLPYRPCAGLCVINRKGLVFIGRRSEGPEHTDGSWSGVSRTCCFSPVIGFWEVVV